MRSKAQIVEITPNMPRILETIVFLVSQADKLGKSITQYDIVKSVFLADRRHLNEYGRPITFDRYVAMPHGPVPSKVYDLLKANPDECGYPWTKVQSGASTYVFQKVNRSFDEGVLAESDCEALSEALVTVKSLGFSQIRKLTHEDPAYIDAWEDDPDRRSFDMSYAMLFDVPDIDKAINLKFMSENI